MGGQFEWQLAFALVLPTLVPVVGIMIMMAISLRNKLKRERQQMITLMTVARGNKNRRIH